MWSRKGMGWAVPPKDKRYFAQLSIIFPRAAMNDLKHTKDQSPSELELFQEKKELPFRFLREKIYRISDLRSLAAQSRPGVGPICSAMATALNIARALFTVSSYSFSGTESATIPAPLWM
jgi:hypothetical protein